MSITLSHDFHIVKFWTESNILYCQFLDNNLNHNLTVRDMGRFLKAIEDLTKGKCMPLVVDLRNVVCNFTVEAFKLLALNDNFRQCITYEAFITNSVKGKLMVLAYKRIFEPSKPYDIFDNMEMAVQYCTEVKKKECKPQNLNN
ncbi:hypothetical protein [Winogradskyella sp.]|uniref:DUF7793 family protein n=1 Tax=Winogradskyella sp. TaxID=1883156 RepID=UPI003511BDD6